MCPGGKQGICDRDISNDTINREVRLITEKPVAIPQESNRVLQLIIYTVVVELSKRKVSRVCVGSRKIEYPGKARPWRAAKGLRFGWHPTSARLHAIRNRTVTRLPIRALEFVNSLLCSVKHVAVYSTQRWGRERETRSIATCHATHLLGF